MTDSGDPRVVFALTLLLSAAFSATVVSLLAFAGALTFSWRTVAGATLALALVTRLVVR